MGALPVSTPCHGVLVAQANVVDLWSGIAILVVFLGWLWWTGRSA